jgi:Tol biopolymer transport system component
MLGGSPGVLIRDVDSPATFSPDGRRLAFLRERHDTPFFDLLIANSDGTGEHALFSSKPLATDSAVAAWSPDGKTLAIPITQPTRTDLGAFLMVDTTTGKESTAGVTKTSIFHSPVWMPDGHGLVFAAIQPQVGKLQLQLAYLGYPQGELRMLTSDTNNYVSPSLAADGKSLVATEVQVREQLSVTSASAPSDWHPLQLMSDQLIWSWDWTLDGRLLLPQAGDIRVVTPAGGEKVVFSDREHIADQVASCAGGHTIVFRQFGRSGAAINLWRMDEGGGNEKQLTFGLNEAEPRCANDGKWLYFRDHEDNRHVKRVPLAGGKPETVVDDPVGFFDVSHDGTRILSLDVREEDHKLIARIDSADEHKTATHDIDQRAQPGAQFAPDGQAMVYVIREKGVDNLWEQGFDGSPAKQLTHFTADHIFSFMYSRDGSQLAIERGHAESDAILLRDTSAN